MNKSSFTLLYAVKFDPFRTMDRIPNKDLSIRNPDQGTSGGANDGGKLVNGLQKLTNHERDRLNTLYFFLSMKIFFSKISHFILSFIQNEPFL